MHESLSRRNKLGGLGVVNVRDILLGVVVGADIGSSMILSLFERHVRVGLNGSEPSFPRRMIVRRCGEFIRGCSARGLYYFETSVRLPMPMSFLAGWILMTPFQAHLM